MVSESSSEVDSQACHLRAHGRALPLRQPCRRHTARINACCFGLSSARIYGRALLQGQPCGAQRQASQAMASMPCCPQGMILETGFGRLAMLLACTHAPLNS